MGDGFPTWRLCFFIDSDGSNWGRIDCFYNMWKAKSRGCKLDVRGLNIVRSRAGGLLIHLLFKFAACDGAKIIAVLVQYTIVVRWCILGSVRSRIQFLCNIVKIEHREECLLK